MRHGIFHLDSTVGREGVSMNVVYGVEMVTT